MIPAPAAGAPAVAQLTLGAPPALRPAGASVPFRVTSAHEAAQARTARHGATKGAQPAIAKRGQKTTAPPPVTLAELRMLRGDVTDRFRGTVPAWWAAGDRPTIIAFDVGKIGAWSVLIPGEAMQCGPLVDGPAHFDPRWAKDLNSVLSRWRGPTLVVVEGVFVARDIEERADGSKSHRAPPNLATSIELAARVGAIKLAAVARGLPVRVVMQSQWAPAMVGRLPRDEGKAAVVRLAREMYPKAAILGDHTADAVLLARWAQSGPVHVKAAPAKRRGKAK